MTLLNFFEKRLQYKIINSLKSAVCAYHKQLSRSLGGKDSKICIFLRVFKKRPPESRYTLIWDVEVVLRLLIDYWPKKK